MKKGFLIVIILAIILVILIIIFSFKGSSSKIIERSVVQGDFVRDNRSSVEACYSIIPEVQKSNPNLDCKLIDSKRIDSPDDYKKCVDGASIAGCFTCTFECK